MKKTRKPFIIALNIFIFALLVFLGYQLFGLAGQGLAFYRQNEAKLAAEQAFSAPPPALPAPSAPVSRPGSASSAYSTPDLNRSLDIAAAPDYAAKIEELRKTFGNDDIVGYLKIDGTSIDYPVCQAKDNEYYLDHDVYRKASALGALFLDMSNSPDFTDKNSVIYGHNMKSDTMFHALRYYVDKSFYEQHKTITLATRYGYTEWEIFAAYSTTTDFNYIQTEFNGEADFARLLDQFVSKSAYDTGVAVTAADTVLTLSTCNNITDNGRIAVNAKLISDMQ